jgi:ABC-type amino acid transport substrate-binding protein
MFVEATAAEDFLATEQGQDYAFTGPDFHHALLGRGVGAMFRQDQDDLREKIDAAIREVYADGTFDEIAKSYLSVGIRADHLWDQ